MRLGRLRLFDSMRPLYKSAKTTYLGKYATTILCGQVIKEVPADRLLVWQVKQGWEPLCKVPGFYQHNKKKKIYNQDEMKSREI